MLPRQHSKQIQCHTKLLISLDLLNQIQWFFLLDVYIDLDYPVTSLVFNCWMFQIRALKFEFKHSLDHILQTVTPFQLIPFSPQHLCHILFVHPRHTPIQILWPFWILIQFAITCIVVLHFNWFFLQMNSYVKQHLCCSPHTLDPIPYYLNLSLYSISS